jgi:hypothetical protein
VRSARAESETKATLMHERDRHEQDDEERGDDGRGARMGGVEREVLLTGADTTIAKQRSRRECKGERGVALDAHVGG